MWLQQRSESVTALEAYPDVFPGIIVIGSIAGDFCGVNDKYFAGVDGKILVTTSIDSCAFGNLMQNI